MPRNDLPELYGIRARPTDWNRIAQYPGIIRRVIEWNGATLTIDPFFVEDVHRLRSFNLRYLIFFHRIRADRPIIPQAEAFLRAFDHVGGLKPHEIVELDIETTPEEPAGRWWPTAAQCRQWFDYVEPRIGRGAGIYMGTNAPVALRTDPVVASKPWRRPAWTGTSVPGLWWAQQWECRIPAPGFSGNVCQNEIQNYDILNRLAGYMENSLEGQVITRQECGMPPPVRTCNNLIPRLVKGMIVHYTGNTPKVIRNLEEFKRAANGVYSLYTRPISQGGRGMCDHGYNADADQNGNFVWTRDLETMSGAQGSPGNSWYVAIHCQIGGNQEPSEALLNRLCWAAGKVQEKYPGATAVLGHRQAPNMSTPCPGEPMMRHILAGRIRPDYIHEPPPPPPPTNLKGTLVLYFVTCADDATGAVFMGLGTEEGAIPEVRWISPAEYAAYDQYARKATINSPDLLNTGLKMAPNGMPPTWGPEHFRYVD